MKKLFLAIAMFVSLTSTAQSVVREGNTFVQVSSTNDRTKSTSQKTRYNWKDKEGKTYPIWLSKNGRAYVMRVSKKTGNEYKFYLGEDISKQICREMGVTYVEKK